jgi:fluoroquinolone resistance protein
MIFSPGQEHSGIEFTASDFESLGSKGGAGLIDQTFEDCKFNKCNLSSFDLTRSQFVECRFTACDLSNAQLANARMREVLFENCKLLGLSWVKLDDLRGPAFSECILSYCNFVGLKLKKTLFTNCQLREVDFRQADFSESDFKGSDCFGAVFGQTTLLKADFRGALNYLIDPISNKVKGARFSFPEAQGLLAGLGVIIES